MVEKKTGTKVIFKKWAGNLGILKMGDKEEGIDPIPPSKIKLHLAEYLYRTPIIYLSPAQFRQKFYAWEPALRRRIDIDKQLDVDFKRRKQEPREAGSLDRLKVDL
jgi:hypothetical protein